MNKKLIVLPIVSLGLLISCNNNNNSDNSLSSNISDMTSVSESSSSLNDEVSSGEISSSDSTSSNESSSEKISVKDQLLNYLNDCVNNNNYTIVNDESTSYYVSNAYYTVDSYDVPHGYAEDENGIFSYTISNEIVESVNYLKVNESENAKGLYNYSQGNYSWLDKTSYLFNSFANISLDDLKLTRVKNSKVESYTVPFETFSNLLIENHLQSFISGRLVDGEVVKTLAGVCTLSLVDGGFNVAFKSSATYSTFNYIISNIGTTEMPVIENYIASGGVQTENFYTRVVSLFASNNFKVTFESGVVRYVTPSYIVDVSDNKTSGYFISSNDSLIYQFEVVDESIQVVEEPVELVSLNKYFVNSSFLHEFTLKNEKLILDSYVILSRYGSYFTDGEIQNDNYIGYAEITADLKFNSGEKLDFSKCNVTLKGKEYDKNEGVLLDNYYSAIYSDFGSASFDLLDNYLKTN